MGFAKVVQFDYRESENSWICGNVTLFLEKQERPKMTVVELIELAKKQSGMSLGQMADELGIRQDRITEWKKGQFNPDAGVLAYFADKAGLNVAETVMEIERTLDPRFAPIWEKALGNFRAALAASHATTQHTINTTTEMVKL